jgi:ketosteroid isomerase-like protein
MTDPLDRERCTRRVSGLVYRGEGGMMRRLVISTVVITVALLSAAPMVVAQSSDEAAVNQAVEAFRNAILKADRGQFEALTANQLSYGHSAGRIENKAEFIDAATSGRSRWKFITLTDQTTQIVGDTAIVRHTLTGETERDGKANPVKIGVLMVWHKQDGNWKLLARQAVRLEEPRTN